MITRAMRRVSALEAPLETLTIALAKQEEERLQIFDLRQEVYQDGMDFLLGASPALHPAQDPFDDVSYLFYAHNGERVIGTGRFTPCVDGNWDIPELSSFIADSPGDASSYLIPSRAVVHPAYRSAGILTLMTHVACAWLARSTSYSFCMGVCVPPLVSLYRRLGFEPHPNGEIGLHGRPRRYMVVGGPFERIAVCSREAAEEQGFCLEAEATSLKPPGEDGR